MLLDPQRLIDRSIADLQQLAAILTAEADSHEPIQSPEFRACEEAVSTISNLIPRLKVVRTVRIAPLELRACPTCDEN